MFFEAFSPEIVYDSNMLEHQTNPHFNAYEKHIIAVILFVSALLGLGSEADEYKTEQNIAYKVLNKYDTELIDKNQYRHFSMQRRIGLDRKNRNSQRENQGKDRSNQD